MEIGQIIHQYRKEKNMTQEDMANRLGVTAPAVNKWEKGKSYPDILLLTPISRLLGISLDILLSYEETLSEDDINAIIIDLEELSGKQTYHETFLWAQKQLRQYPNCLPLLWQITILLDSWRSVKDVINPEQYDEQFLRNYNRILESQDKTLQEQAAETLFYHYIERKQYDKASSYLPYFNSFDRREKQALLYSKTNNREKAYKQYEELILETHQKIVLLFSSIYRLSLEDDNQTLAEFYVEKQKDLAALFDMGKYHQTSVGLELAVLQKNVSTTYAIVRDMLLYTDSLGAFVKSPLYQHMNLHPLPEDHFVKLRKELLASFQNDKDFLYMSENKQWNDLLERGSLYKK